MASEQSRDGRSWLSYTTAVALMYGTVEARHLNREYRTDPRLLELTQKVKVSVSEEANRRAPEAMLSTVEVVTATGQRLQGEVLSPGAL